MIVENRKKKKRNADAPAGDGQPETGSRGTERTGNRAARDGGSTGYGSSETAPAAVGQPQDDVPADAVSGAEGRGAAAGRLEDPLGEAFTRSLRLAADEAAGRKAVSEAGTARFTYTVTESDRDMTVRMVLKKRLGFSRRLLNRLKADGEIFRNGFAVRPFADVIPGDVIDVRMPQERSHFEPQDIPIEVVYEDEELLILNKQPWVVVHPTRGHPDGTIANGLTRRMQETGCFYKIRFVNRLDRDTSGLLVVAKNSHGQDAMMKEMKADHVVKRYIGIVHGSLPDDTGMIDLPIGRADPDDIRRCVMPDGYPSVTHYRVLERFHTAEGSFSMLDLRLETGRTHQIRVHLSHIGHPLVGDPLYGRYAEEGSYMAWKKEAEASGNTSDVSGDTGPKNPQDVAAGDSHVPEKEIRMEHDTAGHTDPENPGGRDLLNRQALHSWYLRFHHPVTGKELTVEAPMPQDMEDLVDALRKISKPALRQLRNESDGV